MSSGIENSAEMHDSSTESIEVRHGKEREMDSLDNDFSSSEVTHSWVSEQIKQITEPIL